MTRAMSRTARSPALLGLGLALALAACAGSGGPTSPAAITPTPPNAPVDTISLIGTFGLSTVNAKTLPTVILGAPLYTLEVMSATATMQVGGHYIIGTVTRETVDGHASIYTDTARGTWSVKGSTITLVNSTDASVSTATWDRVHLTIVQMDDIAKDSYVYLKKP
jgi:hypothetical protein